MTARATLAAPAFLLEEVERHRAMLVRRSGLPAEGFDLLLDRLKARVTWVADEDIEAYLATAKEALVEIDSKDVPYLACALAICAEAIWSHDKDFDRQRLVKRVGHPNVADSRKG